MELRTIIASGTRNVFWPDFLIPPVGRGLLALAFSSSSGLCLNALSSSSHLLGLLLGLHQGLLATFEVWHGACHPFPRPCCWKRFFFWLPGALVLACGIFGCRIWTLSCSMWGLLISLASEHSLVPGPLHCEHRVLATRPPGKSPSTWLFKAAEAFQHIGAL